MRIDRRHILLPWILVTMLVMFLPTPSVLYADEEVQHDDDSPASVEDDSRTQFYQQEASVKTRHPQHLLEGILLMEQGKTEGNRELLKKAEELFKSALAENPEDAYVLAYLGNCEVLRGMLGGFLSTKILTISRGFKHLDEANKLWPMNPRIMLMTAWRGLEADILYGRLWQSADYFSILAEGFEGGSDAGWVDADIAQQAYLGLGECLLLLGDLYGARSCFIIALTINPATEWGGLAEELLEDTEG